MADDAPWYKLDMIKLIAITVAIIAASTSFAGARAIQLTNDIDEANVSGLGLKDDANTARLSYQMMISLDTLRVAEAAGLSVAGQYWSGVAAEHQANGSVESLALATVAADQAAVAYLEAMIVMQTTHMNFLGYISVSNDSSPQAVGAAIAEAQALYPTFNATLAANYLGLEAEAQEHFDVASSLRTERDTVLEAAAIFFSAAGVVAGATLAREGRRIRLALYGLTVLIYVFGLSYFLTTLF